MTHGRYAVEREEATPKMATDDRASRKRNRRSNLCENFLETHNVFTVAAFQATSSQYTRPMRLWVCQQYACKVELE